MLKRPLFIAVIVLLITNVITLVLLTKSDDVVLDNEEKITQKEPVASINDEEVSYEDWLSLLRKEYGKQHLEKVIDRSVVSQLAKQKDIKINEKLIDHGIALLTSMQGVIEEDEFVKLTDKWREDLLYRYQLEELLTENETMVAEDIQDHYEKYQNQYNFTSMMQFSHIVVDDMQTAEKVIQELESDALFNLLAMEYSNDEETKDVGGYLGYFTEASQFLPNNYYEIAETMEEDSYSEPIQTNNGIAIIYLHRKLPEITFSYEEMKDAVRRELALSKMEQTLTAKPLWEDFDIDWIYD